MGKWWIMVATVMVAVVILAVCLYGLPIDPPAVYPSGTGNLQSDTTLPPETTEETLPWEPLSLLEYEYGLSSRSNPDHSYKITRQVLPETIENPENLPVIKWVCMVNAKEQAWNEDAVVELNQMLADRDLPYRVQFTILSADRMFLFPWDWFTNPEVQRELEDADLIYSYYTAREMEQWLLPITDHIYGNAEPSLAGALPDLLSWFSYEANGEIYGIPRHPAPNYQQGWRVDPEFMKKYDLTVEDFQKNFWEMDELFAEIYEKNGNQPFLRDEFFGIYGGSITSHALRVSMPMRNVMNNGMYQGIALCFAIDLQAQKPTVVNILESEHFHMAYDAILRYQKAGYMDKASNGVEFIHNLSASVPYTDITGAYYIPSGPAGLRALGAAYMSGINAESAYAEEALSLLERINTDDDLRLQLCYGKEGRDYTMENGAYTLVTHEDGSCYYMDYLSPQAVFFEFVTEDDETLQKVPSTNGYIVIPQEGMTLQESYRANLAQVSYCYLPEILDCSGLDAEMNIFLQVAQEYYPMYTEPENYAEEYYQRMLRDMHEAGMDAIITELQKQLDAWLAEHPDWNPLERVE